MPVNKRLLKNLAIGMGGAGIIGGTGFLSHKIGYHQGANKMSDIMSTAQRNQVTAAYTNGVNDTIRMMSKVSADSFNDELNKIATTFGEASKASLKVGGEIAKSTLNGIGARIKPSYIGGSYKNLGTSLTALKDAYKKKLAGNPDTSEEINSFVENLKKSKMALGTTAVGLTASTYLAKKIMRPQQQTYY